MIAHAVTAAAMGFVIAVIVGAVFKFAEGPRMVSNADMQAAMIAGFGYVQGCFDKEAAIVAAVVAGQITSRGQIDGMGWP